MLHKQQHERITTSQITDYIKNIYRIKKLESEVLNVIRWLYTKTKTDDGNINGTKIKFNYRKTADNKTEFQIRIADGLYDLKQIVERIGIPEEAILEIYIAIKTEPIHQPERNTY